MFSTAQGSTALSAAGDGPPLGQTLRSAKGQNNIHWSRQRDEAVVKALEAPATARQLVAWGLFPNQHKARKRLWRLEEKGPIHMVGIGYLDGFPELVWCTHLVPKVQHDVEVTDQCDRLRAEWTIRTNVPHDADAEIGLKGIRALVENDRGSMNMRQMQERAETLRGYAGPILWITSDDRRIERLVRVFGPYPEDHRLTTYSRLKEDPDSEIWTRAADSVRD